jgi:hypothetical protein
MSELVLSVVFPGKGRLRMTGAPEGIMFVGSIGICETETTITLGGDFDEAELVRLAGTVAEAMGLVPTPIEVRAPHTVSELNERRAA